MKLHYTYSTHGFSGGMMLSNSTSGEWHFDTFQQGATLACPNSELQVVVQEKTCNSVLLNVKYRQTQATLQVSCNNPQRFGSEANAYGFSIEFAVKE